MKLCMKCNQTLPLTEFYYNKGTSDKCASYCKICTNKLGKQYRQENRAKLATYDHERWKTRSIDPVYKHQAVLRGRQWVENNREKHRAKKIRWKKSHPLEVKAVTAVKDAIRSGKLTRHPCTKCSSNIQLEAHHADYAKPLAVTWLCRKCHIALHVELNQC